MLFIWEVLEVNFLNDENNQKLAEYLHNKRIEQNLNLDDISNKIAIPIQHLKKIEEGDFEDYDAFYLKMYLKKYATALSLDIDELYQLFYGEVVPVKPEIDTNVKKTVTPTPKYSKVTKETAKKSNKNIGKIIGIACATVVIIIGLVIAFDIVRNMMANDEVNENNLPPISNPHNEDGLQENQTEEANQEEELPVLPEEEAPTTTINRLSHQNNTQTYEVLVGSESAEIILNFTGPCWIGALAGETIGLDSGSEMTAAGVMYAEGDTEVITINDSSTIAFNVGNVQTLEMIINGEVVEIETAGLSNQVIVLEITMEQE